MREGWFLKYIQNNVLDIGCGNEPVSDECARWDIAHGNGDATFMEGIPDHSFDTVYSFHLLEHLQYPQTALRNWFRILKPGGWLIVGVPHRDLYEKKQLLPSSFNADHKTFWLPVGPEPPDTLGLLDTFQSALGAAFKLQSLVIQDSGHFSDHEPNTHPVGEYTIEIIVRKV